MTSLEATTQALKDLSKSWAKLDTETRDLATEEVLAAVGTTPIKVLRALELCPYVHNKILSHNEILPRAIEEIRAFQKEGETVDSNQLMAALKVLVYSCSVTTFPSYPTHLEKLLLQTIDHCNIDMEVALVAGTSLAKMIIKTLDSDKDIAEKYLEIIKSQRESQFTTICIIEGILNCGRPELLLEYSEVGKFSLFEKVLDLNIKACSAVCTHSYQNFQSLKIMSLRLKELAKKFPVFNQHRQLFFVQHFSCYSARTMEILRVAENNWENPLKGVSELMIEVYSNVLDVCRYVDVVNHEAFLYSLLQANMVHMQWKNKAKYPVLEVLILKLGAKPILQRYPMFAKGLAHSLTSSYVASAGSAVYRAIIKQIDLETWVHHFKSVLESALTSNESLVQRNVKNQWLPITVERIAGASSLLKNNLSTTNSFCGLAAVLLIMKIERQMGKKEVLGAEDLHEIDQGLKHSDINVRSAAFSVICHFRRKGVPPTAKEMEMVLDFLKINLIIDSSSFRQCVQSDLTLLLIRCRDTLVFKLRKAQVQAKEMQLIVGLDNIMETLLRNCYPGANYQRLITCLDILHLFNNCFFQFDAKGMNKGSGNGDPEQLVQFCEAQGVFRLYTRSHFNILISCMQFYMTNVREKAQRLLVHFSPGLHEIMAVAELSFKMLCSPKFGECESGSGLLQLVQHWAKSRQVSLCKVLPARHLSEFMQRASPELTDISSISEYLLLIYESLIKMSKTSSFLLMTKECPMHGILMALRFCLEGDKDLIQPGFLQRLLQLLVQSVEAMLGKLSQEDGGDAFNASFADMSNAIESLLEKEEDSVKITEDHQLILACAWLNIKECSLLAGHIVGICNFAKTRSAFSLSTEQVSSCGDLMLTVITKCRHKGAIEATNLAIKEFSTRLLTCADSSFARIPRDILCSVLDQVEFLNASVTRRSAGLPMFIQTIVSSEPRGKFRDLLNLAISRLLQIVCKPTQTDLKETEDNAQCHALHVLRSIVHDSVLAYEVTQYLSSILVASVDQFVSPCWSIRNAALQLFGSLGPRFLGQKKVKDEESQHNTLTVGEFFMRYADIVPYLLRQIKAKNDGGIVNPALVPLLSILSRISPGILDNSDHLNTVNDFKEAFSFCLNNCVINVRQLAAKAFASFTSTQLLIVDLKEISRKLKSPERLKTNLQNGLLLCLKELAKQMFRRDNVDVLEVKGVLHSLADLEKNMCCTNKVVLLDLYRLSGLSVTPELNVLAPHEPFFLDLQNRLKECLFEENRTNFSSRSEGMSIINRIQESPSAVVAFFVQALDSPYFNGAMIIKCNDCINLHKAVLFEDPEAAMELLDATMDERITNGSFGATAKTSSLFSAATAFSVMMVQEDFDMFFRDESPYVAQFVSFAEQLQACSNPRNVETTRLHVSIALKNLVPIFNKREVSTLPLLMQYGFVHALNSALTLTVDEDTEIREVVTEFANLLEMKQDAKTPPQSYKNDLCTHLAVRKIVTYGLSQFKDCLEWFQPIIEVFFLPWRDNCVATLKASMRRQCLFENGEGINVYSENIATTILFEGALREWIRDGNNHLKLALDIQHISDEAEKLLQFLHYHISTQSFLPSSIQRSAQGYLIVTRFYNLLRLVKDFPSVCITPTDGSPDLANLIKQFELYIMHL